MANELMDALAELADRFVRLAAEDDQLRTQLRRLAEAILREIPEPAAGSPPAAAQSGRRCSR